MRKAIQVISGFTEDQYEETGSTKLSNKLFDQFSVNNGHDDMTIVFPLKAWNHDWKGFASYLNQNGFRECFVASYSWGGGYGLREFAKHYDGKITAVLCDPVYYSKFWLTRWLAMTHDMTIKYPSNVTVLQQFAQKMDEPGNDKVKSQGKIIRPTYISKPHSQIDDSETYHRYTILKAKEYADA